MNKRLNQVMAMNPDFAEALADGKPWAVDRAESIRGIDGRASRTFPDRSRREDGKPRNWCGSCPHIEGCVCCDLPEATGETYQALKRFQCED
jgi:hypothetical protein